MGWGERQIVCVLFSDVMGGQCVRDLFTSLVAPGKKLFMGHVVLDLLLPAVSACWWRVKCVSADDPGVVISRQDEVQAAPGIDCAILTTRQRAVLSEQSSRSYQRTMMYWSCSIMVLCGSVCWAS